MVKLEIKWLDEGMREHLPRYQTSGAAGMDLCSAESCTLKVGERVLLPCGFAMAIPEGFEVQVRPRSGLAYKHGITVLNAPGTIDSDYRGELKVLLVNLGQEDFKIERGDRIAQMVLAPVVIADWHEVENLSDSRRGVSGFGHTGT